VGFVGGLKIILIAVILCFPAACLPPTEDVVRVTTVSEATLDDLDQRHLEKIEQIKQSQARQDDKNKGLKKVIQETANYTVKEYLAEHPAANRPEARDFKVGGYDILNVRVYEEPDLTRESVPVSAEGYISFPLIGRVKVEGLTTSQIENRITEELVKGRFFREDAPPHVSVTVQEFKSKKYMVLGSINSPGTYQFQAQDRVIDAISRAGGVDFEKGVTEAMIIRTENPGKSDERKIVIRIGLDRLLKGGDQVSNLLIYDKDLLYIPKSEGYYILGEVGSPGQYPYTEKEVTLVEAIGRAGGFTPIAARNRTRIIRQEDGKEKIITVKVDAITEAGMKGQDIQVMPGDVIIVPESYF
jgi:polysaccharide export outer membrane protein